LKLVRQVVNQTKEKDCSPFTQFYRLAVGVRYPDNHDTSYQERMSVMSTTRRNASPYSPTQVVLEIDTLQWELDLTQIGN
jgi:hypothetical protein